MPRPKICKKCNKPKRPHSKEFRELPGYCECGRPPIIDKNVLQKLEIAFSNALSDEKACAHVGISPRTLYYYQEKNPEYLQEKEALKLRPDIKAQQTIINNLGDPNYAWKWLERRDPDFIPASKIEHSGSIETGKEPEGEISEAEKVALDAWRVARRKRIQEQCNKLP
jgi:hypothetical protein